MELGQIKIVVNLQQWSRLGALVLSVGVVLGYGLWGMDWSAARWLQTYWGYYFCLSALVLFGGFLLGALRSEPKALWRARWRGTRRALTMALLGAVVLQLHQPSVMKVYNDEPTHMMTAQMMAVERVAAQPGAGHYEGGSFVHAQPEPFYRMYFFPFLVSILHNLTGERLANGYVLNFAASVLLLFCAFLSARSLSRCAAGGYLAQLLLVTWPLLSQTTTSLAYDVVNLAALSVFFYLSVRYFRQSGASGLNLAISSGILLAYCRSEAVLFLLALGVLVLLKWQRERRLELTWYAVLSPVFLLVPLAARVIGEEALSELTRFYPQAQAGAFHVSYVGTNLQRVGGWFFSGSDSVLNSLPLSILGLLALCGLLTLCCLGRSMRSWLKVQCPDLPVLLAFSVPLALQVTLVLFHFWNPTEGSAVRFFLPTGLYLSLLGATGLGVLAHVGGRRVFMVAGILCAVTFWLVGLPKSARAEQTQNAVVGHYARQCEAWVAAHDDGRTLYARASGHLLLLRGYPATTIRELNADAERVRQLIEQGVYRRILVFHDRVFDGNTNQWTSSAPAFPLSDIWITRRVATMRGFIQSVLTVDEVLGYRTATGEAVYFDFSEDVSTPQFDSDASYFNHVRELH